MSLVYQFVFSIFLWLKSKKKEQKKLKQQYVSYKSYPYICSIMFLVPGWESIQGILSHLLLLLLDKISKYDSLILKNDYKKSKYKQNLTNEKKSV